MPRLEDFPWTLTLLGEEPRQSDLVDPSNHERRDLKAYRKRAAQVAALFPESNITDMSAALEQMGVEIE